MTDAASMMDTVTRTNAVHISVLSIADLAPPTIRVIPIHDLPAAPVGLARLRDPELGHVRDFVADAEAALARSSR
jgi:hypothetical protein